MQIKKKRREIKIPQNLKTNKGIFVLPKKTEFLNKKQLWAKEFYSLDLENREGRKSLCLVLDDTNAIVNIGSFVISR